MLATAMKTLKGRADLEEAAFTAVELLRLNVLNSDPAIFPYNGAPMRGEGKSSSVIHEIGINIDCRRGEGIQPSCISRGWAR